MWRMVSRAGAVAQHRQLAFIDAHRAIFAGMIHPDHGLGVGRGAGRLGLGLRGMVLPCARSASFSDKAERAQGRDQERADRIVRRHRQAEQRPGDDIALHFRRRHVAAQDIAMAAAGGGTRQHVIFACRSDRRRSVPTPARTGSRSRPGCARLIRASPSRRPICRSTRRRYAPSAANDTSRKAGCRRYIESPARPEPGQRRRRPPAMAMRSARKDGCVIMESLELQRIAARIEEKECCLFARQSFETNAGLDDETKFSCPSGAPASFLPFRHGKNCAEMTHRHLIAIHIIMCFVSGLVRA